MISEGAQRKIDLNHISFYRAWIQGIDLREAANLYLDPEIDLREAKTALAWIRDELVRAARRHGKLGYARLLRIRIPDRGKQPEGRGNAIPTLDDFYQERNPDGFYTEAEMIQLYLAEYPEAGAESPKEKRVSRLINRQLEAINWATNFLATPPMPSDSVMDWFDKPMATRFVIAGILTVGDLCDRIRAKGYRWWDGVRQLGEVQGTKIVRWLTKHKETLGALGIQATSPVRACAKEITRELETGIVPIESFALPHNLDGSNGANRALAKSRIPALNDHQAIMAWLAAKATNQNTKRSYRREAERLLLWAVLERGQALSSIDIEGGTEYRDWLAALGRTPTDQWRWRIPQDRWIGKRNIPRWSPEWRPFEGALSLASQYQAYTILKSMFEWMVKVRYLDSNPFDGVAKPVQEAPDASPDLEMGRALTRGQWSFLMEYLAGLPNNERNARLRFVLTFAYATGLRLSELVDARTGRLYAKPMRDGLGVRWMLKVLGKGQKWRTVPMPSSVMEALSKYLAFRELPSSPSECDSETRLIAPLSCGRNRNRNRVLSPSMLYKLLKSFFNDAALELETLGHREDAERIRKASTHWLRHTRGSHSAETMPINMVQRLLGHASLTTTSIYTNVDEEELYEAMEKEMKSEC